MSKAANRTRLHECIKAGSTEDVCRHCQRHRPARSSGLCFWCHAKPKIRANYAPIRAVESVRADANDASDLYYVVVTRRQGDRCVVAQAGSLALAERLATVFRADLEDA